MDKLEAMLYTLDNALNSRKRRHIAGGVLLSISLLFGGLAVTILSLRTEENEVDDE